MPTEEIPSEKPLESEEDPEEEYKNAVLLKALRNVEEIFAGVFLRSGVPSKKGKAVVERCFDGNNAKLTMDTLKQVIYQFLTKDFFNIPNTIESYKENLSPETVSCLESDSDVSDMLMEYQLYGKSLDDLYVKIAGYGFDKGFDKLVGRFSKIGHQIKYGNMENAGSEIGKLFKALVEEENSGDL